MKKLTLIILILILTGCHHDNRVRINNVKKQYLTADEITLFFTNYKEFFAEIEYQKLKKLKFTK